MGIYWRTLICQIKICRFSLGSVPFTSQKGRGTLRRRRSAFSIFRVEAAMALTLLIDGASILSIPLCPLTVFTIANTPIFTGLKNWDITLRKYQLHCLQYHMPVWSHLLLLVGEQQPETGTRTEGDKEEVEAELKWHWDLMLAGAVFRTEDMSCSMIVTKMNIFL